MYDPPPPPLRWVSHLNLPRHPPLRRGSRIQKGGGGSYIQKGGGFVQEFQERIQIVAGPWANQQAKQNCRQPWGGGGSDHPKTTCIRACPCCHPIRVLGPRYGMSSDLDLPGVCSHQVLVNAMEIQIIGNKYSIVLRCCLLDTPALYVDKWDKFTYVGQSIKEGWVGALFNGP